MKNQLREVPKFENIKEIIYNSVKLYPENIAYTIKEKKEGDKVEYKNITYTQLLEDINAGVKNPNELDYVVVWKLEDSDIKIINQPKYAVSFDEFKRSLDDKHLRASGALLFTNIQNHKIYIIELEKLMNNNIV